MSDGVHRRLLRLWNELLGVNARNLEWIYPHNPRREFPKVDDKLIAKTLLEVADVATPRTLAEFDGLSDIHRLDPAIDAGEGLVLKPACASRGTGILVALPAVDGLRSPNGETLTRARLHDHLRHLLCGLARPDRLRERAFAEELLRPDAVVGGLAPGGLPDIRVLVVHGTPRMAMLRIPTRRSGGRANLHQGAVGVGIDLEIGRTTSAVLGRRLIDRHPDTGRPLAGIAIPDWAHIVDLSVRAAAVVDLGYIGVDLILDAIRGALVIELNARPGLSIQLANRQCLRPRLEEIPA